MWRVIVIVVIIIIALCLFGNTYSISGGNETKYEILQELGSGAFSDAYMIKHHNYGKCVLKRSKVLLKDVDAKQLAIKSGDHKNELDFYNFIDTLKNEQKYFVKLYESKIYRCKHIHKLSPFMQKVVKENKTMKKKLDSLKKSPYCIDYILEFAGNTIQGKLFDMIRTNKVDYNYTKRLALDIINAIDIMQKSGYVHNDLHSGNITEKNGEFKVIDYGEMQKSTPFDITIDNVKSFNKENQTYMKVKYNYDLGALLGLLCGSSYFWIEIVKEKKGPSFDDYLRHFYKNNVWDDVVERIERIIPDPVVKYVLQKVTEWMPTNEKMPKKLGIIFDTFNVLVPLITTLYYEELEKKLWEPIVGKYNVPLLLPKEDIEYLLNNFNVEKSKEYLTAKIKLTNENINIIQINSNEELDKYKDKLTELTRICEPNDNFTPLINEPYDIFWLAQYKENNDIIGYLKSTDLKQYETNSNFELGGGIVGKKGLQISGACNGMPDKYSNMASLLLNNIEQYALSNGYEYILLHAGVDREYLISDGPRKGLYIKAGFKKDRILKKGDFSNIDVWIMYKFLNV